MKYIKAIALDLFLFIINFIAIFYAKNVLGRVCLIVATERAGYQLFGKLKRE